MTRELHDILQQILGDQYAVERELGGGGMSRVFVATERSLGRRVVIKVLPPELASGVSAARFQREILVTANLQHPHVLPVLAAGAQDDILYYVMPFVEGQSLRERLTFDGPLPLADALTVLREIGSALAQAHARGIVHRDVKPENILLSGGHAVLADFGIARAIQAVSQSGSEQLTGTGFGVGTLGYMAPEQLAGDPTVDARADVFALGVVAYEMLAGHQPFHGSTPHALASAYFADSPEPLEEVRTDVPSGVSRAIMRALDKSPDQRFPTAAEFRDALGPTISQEHARVRPRHRRALRIAVAALAMVGLLSLAALAVRLRQSVAGDGPPERIVLAVLPFKNLGPPDDAYFADGITEEVTSRLASISGLGVISRTSADQYRASTKTLRQIADELGANYVLEGSVRWERAANGRGRVRVTPQLIRVRDDSHLWADRFDAELSDVFAVQSEIAEKVAGALAIALGSDERSRLDARPTENLAAYDTYMRGERLRVREVSSPASLVSAAQLLADATAADPSFALAFAKLSMAHLTIYDRFIDHTDARLAAARAAADSALALDPTLPEAHVALGGLHEVAGDFDRASAEYAIAERGRPNDGMIMAHNAAVLAHKGQWNEVVRRLERAAVLDPRSAEANLAAAEVLAHTRAFPMAMRHLERAFTADSQALYPYLLKARLQLAQGDRDGARETGRTIMLKFGAERAAGSDGFEDVLGTLDTTDLATLSRVTQEAFPDRLSYLLWRFTLFELWKPALASTYADSVLVVGRPIRQAEPDDYRVRAVVGRLFAVKGDRAKAIEETRLALEIMPITRDAMGWMDAAEVAAGNYVRVGEHDAALDLLEQLLRVPSTMTVELLRTDPRWAPLRQHPRYGRLVGR